MKERGAAMFPAVLHRMDHCTPLTLLTLLALTCAVTCTSFVAGQEPAQQPAPDEAGSPASEADADPAADDFVTRCSGCHTVGGGKLTGPDLTASIQWPEADLRTAVMRMEPKSGAISAEELTGFIELLKDPAVSGRLSAASQRIAQRFSANLDAPSVEIGRALFHGERALMNRGLPCVSCHLAGVVGGELGPDLTASYEKMGQMGLLSACENASFNIMRTAYRDHPVTRQEALHLTEYMKTLGATESDRAGPPVLWISLGLVAVVLGIGALTQGPPRKGVRAQLVAEAQRR